MARSSLSSLFSQFKFSGGAYELLLSFHSLVHYRRRIFRALMEAFWPDPDTSLDQLFNEDHLGSSFSKSILGTMTKFGWP